MRAEKRKKYIPVLFSLLLVLAVPLTYIRVLFCADELTEFDLNIASTHRSTITTRSGGILHKGSCLDPYTFGNLVGAANIIENSLAHAYQDELKLTGFNPVVGMDSLSEEGCQELRTTLLSADAHAHIKELFGSYNGVCCAYNYVTGEVYMALSLPSDCVDDEDTVPNSLINGCLRGYYIPGSTMKIVALICALDQNPALKDFTFTCTGETELPDGNIVKCHSVHGSVDLTRAIGASCNCYMAGLIQQLNISQAQETLAKLGFLLRSDEENGGETPSKTHNGLSKLTYRYSQTIFSSNTKFSSVWSLIGQGDSEINPLHMATIAAAVANGGSAVTPYLLDQVISGTGEVLFRQDPPEMMTLLSPETAQLTRDLWRSAVDLYYKDVVPEITLAKSGTAEQGNGTTNRMLMGVMEEYHTAFYVLVEGLPSGNPLIYTIANSLVQYLPTAG